MADISFVFHCFIMQIYAISGLNGCIFSKNRFYVLSLLTDAMPVSISVIYRTELHVLPIPYLYISQVGLINQKNTFYTSLACLIIMISFQ